MTFSSKHDAPGPTDPSPATDDLTDHEIAVKMKLFSDNDKPLGCAARRIRRSTGDWPWVWLKDILPNAWSFTIIQNLVALMSHSDLDEVKSFLHNAVKQRSGNELKSSDVKLARRHFGLDGGSQANNINGAPSNNEQHDDEHNDGFFSYKDDAASGKGKSTKRRRLHCDSEFEVEDDTASLISAQSSITRKLTEKKTTSTVTSISPFFEKILRMIRATASGAEARVADNHDAMAATRKLITVYKKYLAELDAAVSADTTNPLTTSLEDANAARNAVLCGKAAFESNLVVMNIDEEVAEVVRKNHADKLAAAESKIDDIEKQIEAEKLAGVNGVHNRAELEFEIEKRELDLKKLQRLGDECENEVIFWASIRNMVSLGPKGMKDFLDIKKSEGASLDEVISSIKGDELERREV